MHKLSWLFQRAAFPATSASICGLDGRSVMAIDIMALPEPGVPFAWEWGLSMQAQEVRLTSAVPSNPHMEALVAGKAAR